MSTSNTCLERIFKQIKIYLFIRFFLVSLLLHFENKNINLNFLFFYYNKKENQRGNFFTIEIYILFENKESIFVEQ